MWHPTGNRLNSAISDPSEIPSIPNFEILGRIGGGAYGDVYLARSVTGMYRAVKVVQRTDFEYEKTFEREFEGIQRYEKVSQDHPGLVDVLHVGRDDEADYYYYVMELADDETGEHEDIDVESYKPRTLSSDLRRHPGRSIDECVRFGVSVANALGHLHSAGLTHRDVKPSNIIFVKGQPKLADVGLVARSGQRTYVGTEGYLPPEGPGTSSADLYSLAMVLYEMHTGKDRMDFPELPTNLEIPPTVNRDQWRKLNTVICRAGSPDPRKRYESAHLFANALREVNASGAAVSQPIRKRKRAVSFGVPAALFAILIGAGFLGYWVWKDTQSFVETNSGLLAGEEDSSEGPPDTAFGPIEELVVEDEMAEETEIKDFAEITTPDPSMELDDEVVIRDPVDEPESEEDKDMPKESEPEPTDEPEPDPEVEKPMIVAEEIPTGKVVVESIPSGATVSIGGEDYGRTKTKVIEIPAQPTEISMTYPGYHDYTETYSIREGTQFIRVPMLLDRSPKEGEPWVNSLGVEFLPDPDVGFISRREIGKDLFSQFRDETGAILSVAAKEGKAIVTDEEKRWAFCDWMTMKDREAGFLGEKRYYRPQPVQGGFFFCLLDDEFGTFILNTEPTGARVTLNGEFVGETPVTLGDVRLGPYDLSLALAGHETYEESGELTSAIPIAKTEELVPDESASLGQNWTNTQQMEMVPLNGLLVAAYETRVRDFREYATQAGLLDTGVPSFPQELTHPAAGIGYADAVAFCEWLTERERGMGLLKPWQRYRLPTDAEWSEFAGLSESGATPEERSQQGDPTYSWGESWPPETAVANFADETSRFAPYIIQGYNDGFPNTSPAGSFGANENGLYDLSGNVWEWVSDSFSETNPEIQVLRGAGWTSYDQETLELRYRNPVLSGSNDESYGFRYVLDSSQPTE